MRIHGTIVFKAFYLCSFFLSLSYQNCYYLLVLFNFFRSPPSTVVVLVAGKMPVFAVHLPLIVLYRVFLWAIFWAPLFCITTSLWNILISGNILITFLGDSCTYEKNSFQTLKGSCAPTKCESMERLPSRPYICVPFSWAWVTKTSIFFWCFLISFRPRLRM